MHITVIAQRSPLQLGGKERGPRCGSGEERKEVQSAWLTLQA